ncbi:MAG TPA: hypothetical protein VF190_16050 [Rhodothermales bacterium]
MKRLLLALPFALSLSLPLLSSAQPMLLVGAHYDVARQTVIGETVYFAPIVPKLNLNGFLEVWNNNDIGFPANQVSVFSKHWLEYELTDRLNASLNLEFLYNRAGVDFKWPNEVRFEPNERRGPYVTPKIGFTYRIL